MKRDTDFFQDVACAEILPKCLHVGTVIVQRFGVGSPGEMLVLGIFETGKKREYLHAGLV